MSSSITRTGARRRGDDYQDIVALDLVVEMMEHPERYEWIRVEATEMLFLDDVVAKRKDGRYLCWQVKYANHPDEPNEALTWAMLMDQKLGTGGHPKRSLLMKWSYSLQKVRGLGDVYQAALVTNRPAAREMLCAYVKEEAKIDYDKITDPLVKEKIERQLGGDVGARHFFASFSFWLDKSDLPTLEQSVNTRFKALGLDNEGWLSLKDAMRLWIRERNHPTPIGEITYEIARRAAGWRQLKPLPQKFDIPSDYVLPSKEFNAEFLRAVENGSGSCFVLTGLPGSGKSSYLSHLAGDLRHRLMPVIKHHYSLPTCFLGDDRVAHQRVAESLMSDLETHYSDALGSQVLKNPRPDHLGQWLESCGMHFAIQQQILIVIIDGLDHVFRDKRNLDEVRDVLLHLLPAPKGIVVILGTQPLDLGLFPQKVRQHAPKENWFKLPALDLEEIQEWVDKHAGDMGVNARVKSHEQLLLRGDSNLSPVCTTKLVEQRHMEVESLAKAFLWISKGNPLYLQYALSYLLKHKAPITPEAITNLPPCRDSDIDAYYLELWMSLTRAGHSILHLLAACKFEWPKDAIVDVLSGQYGTRQELADALATIAHLTVESELGLKPFHDSLVVFVENRPDHEVHETYVKKLALDWLRSSSAPDYLRWSNEWLLQADLGDTTPSLLGPCREWATDAIMKRYDTNEMLRKLATACQLSLDELNPINYLRIALLRDYVESTLEIPQDASDLWLESQLSLQLDPWLVKRLNSNLTYLSPLELVTLARDASCRNRKEVICSVIDELDKRLHRKDVGYSSYVSYIEATIVCLALLPEHEPRTVVEFITKDSVSALSVHLMDIYCRELRRTRNTRAFRGLLRMHLEYQEKCLVDQHAVLFAIEERIDLGTLIIEDNFVSPFAAILYGLKGSTEKRDQDIVFPHLDYKNRQRTLTYMPWSSESANMAITFHEVFFCFLANHLCEKSRANKAWLNKLDRTSYDHLFLWALENIARDVAQDTSASRAVGFGKVFELLRSYLQLDSAVDEDKWEVVQAVRVAATSIAFDTVCLSIFGSGVSPSISKAELATALGSEFCNLHELVDNYLLLGRPWLAEEAITWLLEEYAKALNDMEHICTFPERSTDYAKMALLATRHGRKSEAENYLRESVTNLLGYGYHKDLLLRDILEIAVLCHKAGIADARGCVLDVAPAIAKIGDYTDGEMNRYCGESLADVLLEIDQGLLIAYHGWLLHQEDYLLAERAFRSFLKKADMNSPIVTAIAATTLDKESLAIVQARTREVELIESDTSASSSRGSKSVREINSGPNHGDEFPDRSREIRFQFPAPKDYPPEEFNDYLRQLYVGYGYTYWKNLPVDDWLDYWIENGHVDNAFDAMEAAFGEGIQFSVTEKLFKSAFKYLGSDNAFRWLVRGHAFGDGWRRGWELSETSDILERWHTVKNEYPDRWLAFLTESIRLEDLNRLAHYGKDRFEKMIRYCIFMNELEMASGLMKTVKDLSLELVSPLRLPMPDWVPRNG